MLKNNDSESLANFNINEIESENFEKEEHDVEEEEHDDSEFGYYKTGPMYAEGAFIYYGKWGYYSLAIGDFKDFMIEINKEVADKRLIANYPLYQILNLNYDLLKLDLDITKIEVTKEIQNDIKNLLEKICNYNNIKFDYNNIFTEEVEPLIIKNPDIRKLITYISKFFPDPDIVYLDYSESFQDQLVYFFSEVYDNWDFLSRRLVFKVQKLDKSIFRYEDLGFKFTLNELKPYVLNRELNPFIWNKFFI